MSGQGKALVNPAHALRVRLQVSALPVTRSAAEIADTIRKNRITVLVGETGSGKSTQLPKLMVTRGIAKPQDGDLVVCTQPRRVAARALAERVMEECLCEGLNVGVASWVRGDRCDLSDKGIVYVTQGVVVGQIMADRAASGGEGPGAGDGDAYERAGPIARSILDNGGTGGANATPPQSMGWLSRCKVLIVDEAHERDLDTDVILGWCRQVLSHARRDLRVVVCSATISASDFSGFFGGSDACPTLRIGGRMYPVTVVHEDGAVVVHGGKDAAGKGDNHNGRDGNSNDNDDGEGGSRKRARDDSGDSHSHARSHGHHNSHHNGHHSGHHGRHRVRIGGQDSAQEIVIVDTSEALEASRKAVAVAVRVVCNPERPEESSGHVVVFLPGKEECDEARQAFDRALEARAAEGPSETTERANGAVSMVLYGALPLESQLAATVEADPEGRRKVIFSTNVAETSLTIDGVRVVVDAGLEKLARFDQRDGIDKLDLVLASRSSCKQRAGRAGRVAPGVCHRVYPSTDMEERGPYRPPSILLENLSSVLLKLHALCDDPASFPFLSSPPRASFDTAAASLASMGALEPLFKETFAPEVRRSVIDAAESLRMESGVSVVNRVTVRLMSLMRITAVGRKMARLGVEPGLARLLVEGAEKGKENLCLDLAAMMAIRDPLVVEKSDPSKAVRERQEWSKGVGDHVMLVNVYRAYVEAVVKGGDRGWCRSHNLMAQGMRQAHTTRADFARRLAAFEREDGISRGPPSRLFSASSEDLSDPRQWSDFCKLMIESGAAKVAVLDDKVVDRSAGAYVSADGGRADIHMRSSLAVAQPKKVVYSKMHRTKRTYLSIVSKLD